MRWIGQPPVQESISSQEITKLIVDKRRRNGQQRQQRSAESSAVIPTVSTASILLRANFPRTRSSLANQRDPSRGRRRAIKIAVSSKTSSMI